MMARMAISTDDIKRLANLALAAFQAGKDRSLPGPNVSVALRSGLCFDVMLMLIEGDRLVVTQSSKEYSFHIAMDEVTVWSLSGFVLKQQTQQ